MKKLVVLLVAIAACAAVSAHGQMLSQGTMELDVFGSYDNKGAGGSVFQTGVGFGYFVIDNLEAAAAFYFYHDDYTDGYHPALGLQYNFNLVELGLGDSDLLRKTVPFVGGNIGWGIWNMDDADNIDAFVYGVEAGVKYFLVENVALSLSVDADWSSEDLWYEKDGKMADSDIAAHWGLRYFF